MPPQTQSKTVSITNTRLAIATLALVAASAVAFIAVPFSLPEGYGCVASDNGIEIREGENTHYTANNYCINKRTVARFVCNEDMGDDGEVFHSEPTLCDDDELCENGACVRQDYGRFCGMSGDGAVATICADEGCVEVIQTLSDHCINSDQLGKVSCDDDNLIQVTKVDCDNGCVLGDDSVGSCS